MEPDNENQERTPYRRESFVMLWILFPIAFALLFTIWTLATMILGNVL